MRNFRIALLSSAFFSTLLLFTNNCTPSFVVPADVANLNNNAVQDNENLNSENSEETESQQEETVTPKNERLFYVSTTGNDSNPGTQDLPWKTFAKAARTLVGGDTAIIADGVYTEPEVAFKTSGTPSSPITIRAQNQHKAILSSTSECNPNISIYASHIVIEGIRSSISPSNVPCANHNSADGTGVRCWHSNPATPSQPSTGNVGCIVRGVLFDASSARSHAVKTSQDGALVENCTAHSGLEALNSYGNIFRNNTVIGGDAWGSSLLAKGGARNFAAYNNTVYIKSKWGNGIILGGSTGTQWLYDPPSGIEAYNSVAYNNIIINESGALTNSLGMMGAQDSFIFNNIVIGGTLTILPGYAAKPSVNPTVKNNIFICSASSSAAQLNYSGKLDLDHNNFFNCPTPPKQEHAILGDPLLDSNWRLTPESPAIGSGTEISVKGFKNEVISVNKDRDGKPRTLPWDLGIYNNPF